MHKTCQEESKTELLSVCFSHTLRQSFQHVKSCHPGGDLPCQQFLSQHLLSCLLLSVSTRRAEQSGQNQRFIRVVQYISTVLSLYAAFVLAFWYFSRHIRSTRLAMSRSSNRPRCTKAAHSGLPFCLSLEHARVRTYTTQSRWLQTYQLNFDLSRTPVIVSETTRLSRDEVRVRQAWDAFRPFNTFTLPSTRVI